MSEAQNQSLLLTQLPVLLMGFCPEQATAEPAVRAQRWVGGEEAPQTQLWLFVARLPQSTQAWPFWPQAVFWLPATQVTLSDEQHWLLEQ